ncbi:zinc-ribbon domain-containing protein [Paenibacillus brevis]|uniref:Zinc-ribbon domain-containing protein n=1 Tax=Paenibacillus brevis TaxID=2841508 RepID=A0ABS6FKB3_9BACL|nr:zinc-ribbon domain-containing protein [Paenibacillus brevis]MBU5670617.1 zinc-ribbon domain-containing protein [Paenibacillus brevis]
MKERIRRWMLGRYGVDQFGQFLNITALIMLLLGSFLSRLLGTFGFVLILYQTFRIFSRNIGKRSQENLAYISLQRKITGRLKSAAQQVKQSRTHRFYNCPSCKQKVRVPKGKGKIMITCPKCRAQFERKS